MLEFNYAVYRTPPHLTDNYFPATDIDADSPAAYGNLVARRVRPFITRAERQAMVAGLLGISTAGLLFAAIFDPRKERARRARRQLEMTAPLVASAANINSRPM